MSIVLRIVPSRVKRTRIVFPEWMVPSTLRFQKSTELERGVFKFLVVEGCDKFSFGGQVSKHEPEETKTRCNDMPMIVFEIFSSQVKMTCFKTFPNKSPSR